MRQIDACILGRSFRRPAILGVFLLLGRNSKDYKRPETIDHPLTERMEQQKNTNKCLKLPHFESRWLNLNGDRFIMR